MTRRVMLDIETMSLDNNNAVILSCGAVEWAWNKKGVLFTSTALWVLSIPQQLALGREVSEGTQKFWRDQTPEARAHWVDTPPCTVGKFVFDLSLHSDIMDEVWANGIVFDLGNIIGLCKQMGEPTPWKYNAAADARTIYRYTPKLRLPPADADVGLVSHHPVDDCKRQIWGLWEHWPEIDLPNAPENWIEPEAPAHA